MDLKTQRERLGPAEDEIPRKYVPALRADGEAPTKAEDDAEFKRRWIAWGMREKAKADGFGIDWQTQSFEKWLGAITFAEVWAESQEEAE